MRQKTSIKDSIAKRLALARKQAGLSQDQVAKLLGLQRPAISEAEAGRRNVTAEELTKMAEIYGVSLSWLTDTNDEENPEGGAKIQLAARELGKLAKDDFERVIRLLVAMRTKGKSK